ncbi:uncharacterized protein FOMMEDRAFT_63935, partial [Fomitiporia mediterranea MF3/22]|uniref:uncharacterized protein n=1 Tax=Fomitiporia mediterranea (strain MF3/22) TaxID=694068 RepID=UPI0004408283
YKKVMNKVHPVPRVLPEEFCIVRQQHPNPLARMPILPTILQPFVPTGQLTEEQMQAIRELQSGFLWPEEWKLAENLLMLQSEVFVWTEEEQGTLDPTYFDPIRIPTVEHVLWVEKSILITHRIEKRVIELLKEKLCNRVIELSNSSYQSQWFCVTKKDRVSLQ